MPSPDRYASAGKTLRCPGLQPSDYYLFKTERAYFNFDMRQLLTLGLRCIHAGMHGTITAEQIKEIAADIANADLDKNDSRVYRDIATLAQQIRR